MENVVSIREKMIDKVVEEMLEQSQKRGDPVEIVYALENLMKQGRVNFVRRDGHWAFYLNTEM